MYRKIIVFAILGFAVMMTACKKDKTTDPYQSTFSDLTVEQNKTNLENNGIDLINEMEQMKSGNAIEVTANLANLADSSGMFKSAPSSVFMPVTFSKSISQNKITATALLNALKSMTVNKGPANLQEAWDSIVGKYTWNPQTAEFDKTQLSDEVIIEFPGKKEDLTNTAAYTINGFQYATITDPMFEVNTSADFQLPTALHIDLKYNSVVVTALDFSASYQNTGLPTNVSITWTVDNFSLNFTATHSPYTNASVSYTLKHADQILIDTKWEASGDWSQDNIDNSTVTEYDTNYYQMYDYGTSTWVDTFYVDEWQSVDVEKIIRNANAYFTVMNIKVIGQVNINALVTKEKELWDQYEKETITQKEYAEQLADAINANAKLAVIYVDSNTKIADAEAYAY